jgi:hypothetical protein
MFGLIISIVVTVLYAYNFWAIELPLELYEKITLATVGLLFLTIGVLSTAFLWRPIVDTEMKRIPKTEQLFFQDKVMVALLASLFAFALFSCSFLVVLYAYPIQKLLFMFWMLAAGISFDCMLATIRRMQLYAQPFFIIPKLSSESVKAVRKGHDKIGVEWFDALIEALDRAVKNKSTHHAHFILEEIENAFEKYVQAEASYMSLLPEIQGPTLLDKVNYLTLRVCKRLEAIGEHAFQEQVETIVEDLVTSLGKLSLFLARVHPTLSHIPLFSIDCCAQHALQFGSEDVVIRSSATISELCKNFILLSKEKNTSYKQLIFTSLLHLEEIAKAFFQKNKEMSPALLMQPFAEVGIILADKTLAEVVDREEILQELKRILTEFNALDLVLTKLPVHKS